MIWKTDINIAEIVLHADLDGIPTSVSTQSEGVNLLMRANRLFLPPFQISTSQNAFSASGLYNLTQHPNNQLQCKTYHVFPIWSWLHTNNDPVDEKTFTNIHAQGSLKKFMENAYCYVITFLWTFWVLFVCIQLYTTKSHNSYIGKWVFKNLKKFYNWWEDKISMSKLSPRYILLSMLSLLKISICFYLF